MQNQTNNEYNHDETHEEVASSNTSLEQVENNDNTPHYEAVVVEEKEGLSENVAGLLCYLAGIITGVIFLFIEKENRFIRFHALQSIFVSLIFGVIGIFIAIVDFILSFIPVIGWLAGLLISGAFLISLFGLWIFLMVQAYQGKTIKIPLAGHLADNIINK